MSDSESDVTGSHDLGTFLPRDWLVLLLVLLNRDQLRLAECSVLKCSVGESGPGAANSHGQTLPSEYY